MAKYTIVYADPPWPEAGNGFVPFPTMTKHEILSLPIRRLVNPVRSVIYLWTTERHIDLAIECLDVWGFRFVKSGFTWIKVGADHKPIYSPGKYTGCCSEQVLIGAAGPYIKPEVANINSVIVEPRREMGRKPDKVRTNLEIMYPGISKIELFARRTNPGWTCLGNEIDGLDIFDALDREIRREEATPADQQSGLLPQETAVDPNE